DGDAGIVRVAARVDGKRASIAELARVAVDVVDEGPFLAQFEKEPAGHAFAKDGAEQVDGIAVRVVQRDARVGNANVRLLRLLFADGQPGSAVACFDGIPRAGG